MPSQFGLRTGVLLRTSLILAALGLGRATGVPSLPLLRREDAAITGRTGVSQATTDPHALFRVSARRDFDEYLLARWYDHTKQHSLNSLSQTWGEALEEVGQVSGTDISKAKAEKAMQRVSIGSFSNSALYMPRTICETGFHAGRSLVTLLGETHAVAYEFGDKDAPRAQKTAHFIGSRFPGRSRYIWGNSTETLPLFRKQHPDVRCELLVIDGGSHSEHSSLGELKHFAGMGAKSHLVALDSTRCETDLDALGCGTGSSKAWTHLVERGCIHELESAPKKQDLGFHVGHFTPCALWDLPGSTAPSSIMATSAMEVSARAHKNDVNVDDHRERLDQYALALLSGKQLVTDAIAELDKTMKDKQFQVTEGHIEPTGLLKLQTDRYDKWAHDEHVKTICESGFGAGHSALRFLAQTRNTSVFSFDLGFHPYSKAAVALLQSKFGARFQMTTGDTKMTINSFHGKHREIQCDLIIVDGGNDEESAYQDLGNFAQMASKGHILAIDDTPCDAGYCVGPAQAWKSLIEEGCIVEKEAIQMGKDRGFSIGEYRECPYWPNLYLGARLSAS